MNGGNVLLVVGSGDRAMREPIWRRAAECGPLWLLDSRPPTWQAPYLAGWSVAPLDSDSALSACRGELPPHVSGVLTFLEEHVELVAALVHDLGLPGISLEAAKACRDKATTRQRLIVAGVPQPAVGLAASLSEARDVVERIGYPVVVKPRNLGGSLGVRKAEGPADLGAAFAAAAKARADGVPQLPQGVLIEEYLQGPEISVDSAVLPEGTVPLVIARKRTGPEPWFEEVGHMFDPLDPLFDDAELRSALTEVHRALGLVGGVTHSEWRLTARGPRLIEVNARLGGQLIPYAGACQGVDAVRVACDLARGLVPDTSRHPEGAARVHFLYPSHDLRIDRLELKGELPAGVDSFEFLAEVGDELRLPPAGFQSRYGYALVRGRDLDECHERLHELLQQVDMSSEPLPADRHTAPPQGGASRYVDDGGIAMQSAIDPMTEALLTRRIPVATAATEWPTSPVAASEAVVASVRRWKEQLVDGDGFIVVDTGTASMDDEAVGSAAWNAFTLLTQPIPQYSTGELMYTVEVDASAESSVPQGSSHYSRTSATGGYHTDGTLLPEPPDLAMLACVSAAASGGETIVMDGRGIWDALSREGRELLDIVQRPHPFDAGPELAGPRRPILVEDAGRVRLHYLRRYIEQGYANLGETPPTELVRAMDVIDEYTSDEANQTAFPLRRGQVLIFDNSRFVHGRRAFTDGAGGVRRLQRAYGMYRPAWVDAAG